MIASGSRRNGPRPSKSVTPSRCATRLRHAEDGYRWVIARARPVYDEGGALVRWFGTITDVHALTEAEEALRLLNETLETRIEQRTAQVRQLASKLTRAEQAERRRISQILHDDLQQRLYGVHLKMSFIRRDAEAGNQERLAKNVSDGGSVDRRRHRDDAAAHR